jgi:hypothetical protein
MLDNSYNMLVKDKLTFIIGGYYMEMVNVIIGIIMILSFFGLVWYCVKGYNLLVGFFVMSVFWTAISLIGNTISPNSAMEGKTVVEVLTNVFQTGPENYGKSILVNIFFGAFFGRVLIDTGIAATLIRKVVELGGDKPRITMSLLCIVTTIIFTSMTGIGPVISIAVIVLPIMLSLGIPAPVAMFSFMGSIMAGIFGNIVNFKQYQAIFVTANESYASYDYNTYFPFGMLAMVVSLVVVLVVSNIFVNKKKISYAWAATADSSNSNDAPVISWVAVILPVISVIVFKVPIILAFIISALFALLTCKKFEGGFAGICRMLAKQFADGAIDVAPMIGFLLTLSMFNNAANYASPYFKVLLGGVIPESALLLCILFAILTPLGFFRGPMNLVGCGAAILAVVVSIAAWPVQFLYPLFAVTTVAPQHLDVTQSWVAWGFGYTKVATKDYMKMSIPTGWIIGIILCALVFVLYGNLV